MLARQFLAREALNIQSYALSLASLKNRLTPISRLPPEILAAIFAHVAPLMDSRTSDEAAAWIGLSKDSCESHFDESRVQEIRDIKSLISASQVCRGWRIIALHSGGLWANLWTENPRWRTEMQARASARQAPLEIYQPRHDRYLAWLRGVLASGLPYRRLCISMSSVDSLAEILSQPAPWLEVAHIKCDSRDDKHAYEDDFQDTPIPSDLFAGIAPRLRHLRIEGNYPLGDILRSPITHNLKYLELVTANTMPWSLLPSTLDLLHALNQMPRLQILNIECCHPIEPLRLRTSSTSDHPSTDLFLFPNISRFSLHGDSAGCANFAQYIRLHPECCLEYWMVYDRYEGACATSDTVSPLFSVILDFPLIPVRTFYMDVSSSDLEHTTACWDTRLPADAFLSANSGPANISDVKTGKRIDLGYQSRYEIRAQDSVDLDYNVVTKVLQHLRLEMLQDLVIDHNEPIDMERFGFWPAVLRRMPSVEKLVLGRSASYCFPILRLIASPVHFASYFEPADSPILAWSTKSSPPIPDDNANTTTDLPILLPLLSSLYLRRWKFRPTAPLPERFLESLRAISARPRREHNGLALRELRFVDCEITVEQVRSLRGMGIADSVEWDGKTGGSNNLPTYIDDD